MVGRGNQRERAVAQVLRDFGYLVSSRRHEGGAGDLLAAAPTFLKSHTPNPLLLIEVKGTSDVPWRSTFGPEARAEMIEAGLNYGVQPLLAWWPPSLRGGPIWLPVEDWPG